MSASPGPARGGLAECGGAAAGGSSRRGEAVQGAASHGKSKLTEVAAVMAEQVNSDLGDGGTKEG